MDNLFKVYVWTHIKNNIQTILQPPLLNVGQKKTKDIIKYTAA